MGILIQTHGLGKAYPHVHRNSDRLRALGRLLFKRKNTDVTHILRDINLEIPRGESLGVIGENGAGKSTLLKLITGVLTPTTGRVQVNGRVGALLELGAGFHPEYTGRDNIAMAAALYGLNAQELADRLEEIISFADIGAYIDEPVKHYSSGMVVRLGFAVIAALRPELLITDEVLAVGDESFQKKCIQWMESYLADGGTLLLVSHSMYHIQKLCRRACWLRGGEVAMQGDVFDVTQAYLAYHERKTAAVPDRAEITRQGLEFSMLSVALNGQHEEAPLLLALGETLEIKARIHSREGRAPIAMVGFVRADGTAVYGMSSEMDGVRLDRVADNEFAMELIFPELPLLPGSYTVRVHPLDPEGLRLFDTMERAITLRGTTLELGVVRLEHHWRTSNTKEAVL